LLKVMWRRNPVSDTRHHDSSLQWWWWVSNYQGDKELQHSFMPRQLCCGVVGFMVCLPSDMRRWDHLPYTTHHKTPSSRWLGLSVHQRGEDMPVRPALRCELWGPGPQGRLGLYQLCLQLGPTTGGYTPDVLPNLRCGLCDIVGRRPSGDLSEEWLLVVFRRLRQAVRQGYLPGPLDCEDTTIRFTVGYALPTFARLVRGAVGGQARHLRQSGAPWPLVAGAVM
jgi:hypothetical protein